MNPIQRLNMLLLDIQASQIRTEQYLTILTSVELRRIGVIKDDEALMEIVLRSMENIKENLDRQDELKKASTVSWPVKNLAA